MWKKTLAGVIFAAMVMMIGACGKSEENTDANIQATEYVYVPEYVELEQNEMVSYAKIQFVGESMYYIWEFFDVLQQRQIPVLKEFSLAENRVVREMDLFHEEGDLRRRANHYYVQADGSIYTVEDVDSGKSNFSTSYLCAYDKEWNLIWEKEIREILDEVRRNSQIRDLAVDGEGRIHMAVDNCICLFDEKGAYEGNIQPENIQIHCIGADREGRMYVSYRERKGTEEVTCLAEIDFENKKFGETYESFPVDRKFTADGEGTFLVSDNGHMYRYDLALRRKEEILTWVDCDIDGNQIEASGVLEDGTLVALMRNRRRGEETLVFFREVEAATVPEKTQIVIGCFGNGDELQEEAAAFNRQSDRWHVTIRNYYEVNEADPVSALHMALSTGIDCPDILDLDMMKLEGMDVESYTGNGAFEDLTLFLQQSTLAEDYWENVLDSYRYQNILAGIPYRLTLNTIAGKTAGLGEKVGWSLDEMMAYAAENPQSSLFHGAVRDDMLYDCLVFGQDNFIDREHGKCYFDSDAFGKLLTFVGTFPAEYDFHAEERSTKAMLKDGAVLLQKVSLDNVFVLQEHEGMFRAPVTYIGYPAMEGSSGCMLEGEGGLAISAWSSNREAAWEFIEYYLTREFLETKIGFPARKSVLEQQMEKDMTETYYTDANGNLLLDEEGNPIRYSKGYMYLSFEEGSVEFHVATKEETLRVSEMIKTAEAVPTADDKMIQIIREEAEPFFLGQKTLEEVMGIIQSRIQLYLDEQAKIS